MRIQIDSLILSFYDSEYKDVVINKDSMKILTKEGETKNIFFDSKLLEENIFNPNDKIESSNPSSIHAAILKNKPESQVQTERKKKMKRAKNAKYDKGKENNFKLEDMKNQINNLAQKIEHSNFSNDWKEVRERINEFNIKQEKLGALHNVFRQDC